MIGRVIKNRYEIKKELGWGRMATVYLAKDLQANKNVAIKFLHSHFTKDFSYIERLQREAKTATRFNHPNIVKVLDFGTQQNEYFIVMEYIKGQTLAQLLKRDEKPSENEILLIARSVAGALHYASNFKITHRDIKPQNIIVTADRGVKVAGFGMARAAPELAAVQPSMFAGTSIYESPEQARGDKVDVRSDIYSLGITIYEALEGSTPFSGNSTRPIIQKHIADDPMQTASKTPADLKPIIARCLEKDPGNRYQSADLLIDDIDSLLTARKLDEQFKPRAHKINLESPVGFIAAGTEQEKTSFINQMNALINSLRAPFDRILEEIRESKPAQSIEPRLPELKNKVLIGLFAASAITILGFALSDVLYSNRALDTAPINSKKPIAKTTPKEYNGSDQENSPTYKETSQDNPESSTTTTSSQPTIGALTHVNGNSESSVTSTLQPGNSNGQSSLFNILGTPLTPNAKPQEGSNKEKGALITTTGTSKPKATKPTALGEPGGGGNSLGRSSSTTLIDALLVGNRNETVGSATEHSSRDQNTVSTTNNTTSYDYPTSTQYTPPATQEQPQQEQIQCTIPSEAEPTNPANQENTPGTAKPTTTSAYQSTTSTTISTTTTNPPTTTTENLTTTTKPPAESSVMLRPGRSRPRR